MKIYPVTLYLGDTKIGNMTNREAMDYLIEKGYPYSVNAVHPKTGERFIKGLLTVPKNLRITMSKFGYKNIYVRKVSRHLK